MSRSPVKLGPIASRLFSPVPWTDDYPASQEWADELETLLEFCDSHGQLARSFPNSEFQEISRGTQHSVSFASHFFCTAADSQSPLGSPLATTVRKANTPPGHQKGA